jgi:hypothetical protein
VHNGVPIAIPPEDVLLMGAGVQPPAFLVLFFDAKRTWSVFISLIPVPSALINYARSNSDG